MSLRRARAGTWLLLAAWGLLFSTLAFAQTPSEAADSSAGKAPAASASENSGGDETAQLRNSASVKLLARITGLSTQAVYWLAVGLNFAIVAGVIWWAWKRNVPALFRSRTASIQRALDEARQASEDARRRLTEVESRLSRLDDEINQMRATSEKEAAAEEERIKAAAAEDARHIIESAEQEIAAATKAARRELTAYAADLAVTLAAKQIRVDRPTDQALVRSFAQRIGDGAPGKKA
jgi:F-type H+-transporting ATPase subunit b